MSATEKIVNTEKIREHLLSKEGANKIVVLFDDSVTKRKISSSLGEDLRKDPTISMNRGTPFRVQNNMLELGERRVILGLKDDEKYLVAHYPEGIIRYYNKE